KNSPEFEIALSAFNYSIDNYDLNSKKLFLVYSEEVIKDWVISYLRDDSLKPSSGNTNMEKNYLYYTYESKEEINLFKKRLWEFGIKLSDVSNYTPANKQIIYLSLRIACKISRNDTLFEELSKKKKIPANMLDDALKSNKKILSKHKSYIIALVLILRSDLNILKSYLKNIETDPAFSENMGVILEKSNGKAVIFTIRGKFLIIKHNNSKKTGEQIQFGNYRLMQNRRFNFYYPALAASVLIVLAASLLIIQAVKDISGNYWAVDNKVYKPAEEITIEETGQALLIEPTVPPTNVQENPDAQIPASVPQAPENTPVNIRSTQPVMTPIDSPTPKPAITYASAIPDEVRISAPSNKVKVGDTYEIHMFMKSGNNGTRLVLYQNDKEYITFDLVDRTPWAQAKILEIQSDAPGTYTYSWELSNKFGTTRSKTITINVMENILE
ncbi:MAG: RNA polymerase subunit sigma, partial [Clostridiaceae bacterium]|nr:RNA polymerase subunit sigma [Clostridiaceae bacterium]